MKIFEFDQPITLEAGTTKLTIPEGEWKHHCHPDCPHKGTGSGCCTKPEIILPEGNI